jgi:hypothetical protein
MDQVGSRHCPVGREREMRGKLGKVMGGAGSFLDKLKKGLGGVLPKTGRVCP